MGTMTIADHAVVLGGSMAGLLAARVLAESYGRVTVVERDLLPAAAGHRRGVPQGRHVHALRARGRELIEELFEGFTDELVAGGAEIGDELAQARWLFSGQRLARTTTGRTVLSLSRPMLEGHLRARVRAIRTVTVIDGCDVLGLTSTRRPASHYRRPRARPLPRQHRSDAGSRPRPRRDRAGVPDADMA